MEELAGCYSGKVSLASHFSKIPSAHGKAGETGFITDLSVNLGKYLPPRNRSSNPDPLIRGGLKSSWLAVEPSTLSTETRKAVEGWKTIHRDTFEAKEELLRERKERSAILSEERKVEYEKGMERRERLKKEKLKVKILY